MFFQEILPGINPEKMGVLVIHSLNPYGFKHFRRVTEKNIDLNRNFPVDDSLYQVKESSYDPLSNLLEPKEKVTRPLTERLAKSYDVLKGLVFKKYTVKELGDAIGQGQHRYPNGLEYGGNEPEPQVQIFKELVQKYSKGYKRVIYLDLHTGLGSANQLHMMTADGVSYSNTPILQQLLKKDQDGKMYDIASGGDPGFYPTPGDIILYFQKVVVPNQENVGLTMEFGTIGTGALNELKELNRLILENQGHHYGYFDKGVQKSVEEDFHELFCPKSPKWRALVIDKARYVLGKVIERLGDNK